MEIDYGMTEYAIGHEVEPISCLLKELYSDFIVQEILADGRVLPLPPPDLDEVAKEKKNDVDINTAISKPNCISETTMVAMDDRFKNKGEPVLVEVANLSKDERKSIHNFVRERYSGVLISETKETGILVSHGHTKSSRKRKIWDNTLPRECHFTICKENKDSSFACQLLARFLNVSQNSIKTHGIKDKRAVTVQRASVTQVLESKLLSLNSTLRGIKVYGIEYHEDPVQTGAHWGNRFSIILREVPNESELVIEERLKSLKNTGFINYFGTQRFGSRDSTTADIGLAILKRDWEGAVKMIMKNSIPDHLGHRTVGEAARCFTETGDPKKSYGKLRGAQAFATIEGNILQCLSKGGSWQKCITEAIPVQTRSLYVHAYQSLIWNKVASRRVKEYGTRVHDTDVGADGRPLGEQATHFDIYIPLPGENAAFEGCCCSKWICELLEKDNLTQSSFTALKDRFSLGEFARPLFVEAKDLEWKFIKYENRRSQFQEGLDTKTAKCSEDEGSFLALKIQFSLKSGCYATVALREVTGVDMGQKSMRAASFKSRKENDFHVNDDEKEHLIEINEHADDADDNEPDEIPA